MYTYIDYLEVKVTLCYVTACVAYLVGNSCCLSLFESLRCRSANPSCSICFL